MSTFLDPRSVAVIGASSTPGKVGHDILKNLLTQGYEGTVYPVNPTSPEILGKKTYASVKDIPAEVDLAVIVIPAKAVAGALKECAEKKIPSVAVISAGFAETHTEDGKAMEEELKRIAKENGIQLLGPNCLGMVRPALKMNASFAKELPPAGSVALISQSGATAVAIMDAAARSGIGFSAVLSIGNKTVMDETDFLKLCAADPATKVIAFYLESIRDGRAFLKAAGEIAKTKHVVLLKAGVSEHGKKAASSHTGALAGSDSGIDALCAQTGIRRAHTSEELFDLLQTLSNEPPLLSRRIAIVTNAGGPGILATDAAEREGFELPRLEEKNEALLRTALPASASTANPIDVIGDAGADRYKAALAAVRDDPDIDGLVVILTPQVMTPCAEVAQVVIDEMKKSPLMPVVTSFMGGDSVTDANRLLRAAGIPTFETPERAVHAMRALLKDPEHVRSRGPVSPAAEAAASGALTDIHGLAPENVIRAIADRYDLHLPQQRLIRSADEAAAAIAALGTPLVAKIESKDILHKTDVGGIRLNLQSEAEVRDAFTGIMQSVRQKMPQAEISGILLQRQIPSGHEFIVGGIHDPSFGPMILVGLGGIYTELFRDTAFRIAPVDEEEVYVMLQSLTSWPLLLGARGAAQCDIPAFAALVARISRLLMDEPRIRELDVNPVIVNDKGVTVVDMKIIVE